MRVRINSAVRYLSGSDARDENYGLEAIDETMEEINDYTTRLVVGDDELGWKLHSPNVTLARQSAIFESSEYNCGNLEYDYDGSATRKKHSRDILGVLNHERTVKRNDYTNGSF